MSSQSFWDLRKREFLTVSFVSIIIYFGVTLPFHYLQNLKSVVFSTPDSWSYLAVSNWLCGLKETDYTILRPFFYPLLLNLFRSFGGVFGIWFYQFLMWFFAGLLLYQSIKSATNSLLLSIAGYLIFVSNLSLLLLTLHALTETTVMFLLVVLVFFIITRLQDESLGYWLLIVFITSLLTVTKPVYEILLFAVLLYKTSLFLRKISRSTQWKQRFQIVGSIMLVLLPVILQISIMKVKHNLFSVSYIGPRTFKLYYFAKVYGYEHDISVRKAREYLNSFNKQEMVEYLLRHYKTSAHVYFDTLIGNIRTKSDFPNYPRKTPLLFFYMKIVNKVYLFLHGFMLPILFVTAVVLFKKKRWKRLKIIIFLAVIVYLIFLTSGITFWQGDRIVVPAVPVWTVLYMTLLSYLVQEFLERKRNFEKKGGGE